nr:putative lipase YOR059C isoform X1 [Arachis hypogaea]XP_025632951.1 putative lipase YOR059C isoform X1 [Arachis hypogaea]
MEKNEVCTSESVDGSRDVWSSRSSDSSSADHLVVMVNGILGSATDWKFAAEQFVQELPDEVFVHCSERNVSKLTLDGVDVMGERLAEEVREVVRRKPNMRKISFVAHSVGGLVARYAIGKLYRPPEREDNGDKQRKEDSAGKLCGLEAINFITVATPHLGSRGNKQVPFLFGVIAFEKLASCVIHWIFRRTGQHLFLVDDDGGKPPLLKRMVEDCDGCYFMSALRAFKRRVVYSNVGYDHIVGWRTSSIRRDSELPKVLPGMPFVLLSGSTDPLLLCSDSNIYLQWEESLNEKYPHVVYEEHCKALDANQYESAEDNGSDKIEEELVTGLSRVSWEKVDVSFHSSRQRFAAHSVIQVKDRSSHIEGADVIQHMIDHFLT